ncbi:3-oxoacyl-ACP synthase [Schinkia sp. CFF1]
MAESIGITETGIFLPENIETAHDVELKTGIPKEIIIEKFGLYQKHVSNTNMHGSDMAIEAARPILNKIDPLEIDVIIYFGSPYKDFNVWSCAAKIQHELGARNAYAFELMNVSSCFPLALKVAKDMVVSDKTIHNILLVGGCKESHIIDYENPRSRFMFNFADGGAAALIQRNGKNQLLGSSIVTDGSFHDDVKIPAGGSVYVPSVNSVKNKMHFLDVTNPLEMKERLDPITVPNFVKVVQEAVQKSGYKKEDIDLLLPLHTKKSMYKELLKKLGLTEEQSIYLDHYGHMSALDPCIGLHVAKEIGKLKNGDLVVTVSAGTGYTWAATAIKWGEDVK